MKLWWVSCMKIYFFSLWLHIRHWLIFIILISSKFDAKSSDSGHTLCASIKAQMKWHICVETKRDVNDSSLNNVVIDLCLTVWLCPPLTNVFPCSSPNDGDDLWSRLVWARNDVCDAFWFGDGDESGQPASLNYWWRLMKTGESNYFVRCKVRCAFGRMEHILCLPPCPPTPHPPPLPSGWL